MNTTIVHEVNAQRQRLQAAAGTTSNPATLHQIAQAQANINRAVEIYEAGVVKVIATTEDGSPNTVAVGDGHDTFIVVIGRSGVGTTWDCACISQATAYKAACSHKIAAKLASAAAAHQREIQARAQRKAELDAIEDAYHAARQARHMAELMLEQARDMEATTWAAMRELAQQVYWDNEAANAEALARDAEAQASQQAEPAERQAAA
jgi:hypothetical protein